MSLPMLPKNPKHDIKRVLELYRQGLSQWAICEQTGVPRSTIDRYVRDAGIARPKEKAVVRLTETGEFEKLCTKCAVYKPATLDYFQPKQGGYQGLSSECRACGQERGSTYSNENKDVTAKRGKRWRDALRQEVLEHYSNGKNCCACCGENRNEFLVIDHVHGNGNAHRKEIARASGGRFYSWLRTNGFPKGFRVLCHNCNFAIGAFGYCPHEHERLIEGGHGASCSAVAHG